MRTIYTYEFVSHCTITLEQSIVGVEPVWQFFWMQFGLDLCSKMISALVCMCKYQLQHDYIPQFCGTLHKCVPFSTSSGLDIDGKLQYT